MISVRYWRWGGNAKIKKEVREKINSVTIICADGLSQLKFDQELLYVMDITNQVNRFLKRSRIRRNQKTALIALFRKRSLPKSVSVIIYMFDKSGGSATSGKCTYNDGYNYHATAK